MGISDYEGVGFVIGVNVMQIEVISQAIHERYLEEKRDPIYTFTQSKPSA